MVKKCAHKTLSQIGNSDDNEEDVCDVPVSVDISTNSIDVDEDISKAENSAQDVAMNYNTIKPKRNSYLRYKMDDCDIWRHDKILSTHPKQIGNYRH